MSNTDHIPEIVGTATFVVNNQSYQTWYEVIGDLKSGQTPLVTLHGGPGLNHKYMLIHKQLWTIAKIPIVCYDQLGNGHSTHICDAPKEFWTPELFMDELENLVQHLGISDNYDLVGHSWGGMLGAHLAGARQPKGLRHLIIDNSPASMPLLVQGINAILEERLPPDFVAMLHKHEEEGTTDSQEYQDDWDIIDIMHQIPCETLLISAREDEVRGVALIPWFLNVPKIKWVELANGTHLALYEGEARYIRIVTSFLTA